MNRSTLFLSRRYWILLFFLFNAGICAHAQDLVSFNTQTQQTNQRAMMVLGGWAVGNIALGAGLMSRHDGSEKYFHQMNWMWNTVNLGIATLGYLQATQMDPSGMDLYQSQQKFHGIQKTLLFNAGLDIGYIAGGFYLMERSKNVEKNRDRFKGWGKSLVLQGSFLLAFDLSVYFIHSSNNSTLKNILESVQFQGNGLGLYLQF